MADFIFQYNFGPPFYQNNGQIYRNLLGDPIHQAMWLAARQQPDQQSQQASFWQLELQADFRFEDGYTLGAEFNNARYPIGDGTYHRTERCVWKVHREQLTLTVEAILEAKAPESMSYAAHISQAHRDAEEVARTYHYRFLHVITSRSTKFHAWLYSAFENSLNSLFSEEFQGQLLDASVPQASEEWSRFIWSVKGSPSCVRVLPDQVLRTYALVSRTNSAEEGLPESGDPCVIHQ
ncbi:hypothetical protein E4U21_002042 [Claviceps maximensis]|nr:hypothetical protein E4U21_002042 [Claviceps maximensis]